MEAMRESWTDARMDDLNIKVDELGRRVENGFNRVDADLRELRSETKGGLVKVREESKAEFAVMCNEMDRRFEQVDQRFEQVDRRFEQVDGHFDRMDKRLDRMDVRFEGLDDHLAAIHRMMFQFCGLTFAALIGLIATQA